jgi:Arc/MetJ-type ribon-helix-helix transcriptional regulator
VKALHVELPDKVASEIEHLVRSGWFHSEQELIRFALIEFVRRHQLELLEQHQMEDMDWVLQQRGDGTRR